MAKATLGSRGTISGLQSSIRMLQNLTKALRSDASLGAINLMQDIAFKKIEEAVYGDKYGKSLAQIFSRTRPKTKSGYTSRKKGSGTPVDTGRLQNALVIPDAPYGIFKRNRGSRGHFSVTYGADPVDPDNDNERYFAKVERRYKFFSEGLEEFEKQETMENLGNDLAEVFTRQVRNRLARQLRRR